MHRKILIDMLKHPAYQPKTWEELLTSHPILTQNASDVFSFIEELEEKQILYFLPNKTFMLAKNLFIGKFEQSSKYFGFVLSSEPSVKDLYIYHKHTNQAIHGDYVIAKEVLSGFSKNGKTEGMIIYIVEDASPRILGTLQQHQTFGFVVPDNPCYPDIFVPGKYLNNAQDQQKVVVEINQRQSKTHKGPEGEIVEILGYADEPGIDILSILKEYPIPTEFPAKVLEEANNLPDHIPNNELEHELKHRIDLRDEVIITIDSETTKDFDDAVSIKKTKDNEYLLGVHIADVAHYVKEDHPLDKEARKRGTSIYLADRVIPMLPEKLSNGLCSLNPNVTRFALSCLMKIDRNGNVTDTKICESVIKTTERMTYSDVKKIIERTDEDLLEKYRHIIEEIDLFHELSLILQTKRHHRGAIDFDFPEARVLVDKNGKAADIEIRTSDSATRLIEEFMIVCNETVSEYFSKKDVPFLYRIHEKPSTEKIERFLAFMEAIQQSVAKEELSPKVLQSILERTKDTPECEQIRHVLLRSLAKAKYSPEPKGHFGMASVYYSHFTSPIRRYPDLQIHRIIKEFLHHRLTDKRKKHYSLLLPDVANETTEAEITASRCESEVTDYKMCEYMQDKVGEIFEGKVSGVTENGIFVILPNQVEGFVPAMELDTLHDTFYFEEDVLSYVSHRQTKSYTFGTPVKVQLVHVDMIKRKVQFSLIKKE